MNTTQKFSACNCSVTGLYCSSPPKGATLPMPCDCMCVYVVALNEGKMVNVQLLSQTSLGTKHHPNLCAPNFFFKLTCHLQLFGFAQTILHSKRGHSMHVVCLHLSCRLEFSPARLPRRPRHAGAVRRRASEWYYAADQSTPADDEPSMQICFKCSTDFCEQFE